MNATSLKFSIVIPTYNRPDRLEQCLRSIGQLGYPRDRFEVIVVDDGSQLPLTPIKTQFESGIPLRMIRQENAGPASARNTGAAVARGHYLVFTDDDCQVHPDWLNSLGETLSQNPSALVGGCTLNALPENVYSTASQLLIDYLYHYYNQLKGKPTFFASNNFAVPRDQYHKLGGFDTSFPLAAGEDREFCDRWLALGHTMVYAPTMQVFHAHYLTLKKFWRQHFNYGRGAFWFHQVRARRHHQPIQVEPLSFYLQLLTYPIRRRSSSALFLALLLGLSQLANIFGFVWENWHDRAISSKRRKPLPQQSQKLQGTPHSSTTR